MTKNRLVVKRIPMRRTISIDPDTGETTPVRVGAVEIEYNGMIYDATVTAGVNESHPDFDEARYRSLAIAAWRKMANQLLVEAGGPNLDDPGWYEDRTWIEGVTGD